MLVPHNGYLPVGVKWGANLVLKTIFTLWRNIMTAMLNDITSCPPCWMTSVPVAILNGVTFGPPRSMPTLPFHHFGDYHFQAAMFHELISGMDNHLISSTPNDVRVWKYILQGVSLDRFRFFFFFVFGMRSRRLFPIIKIYTSALKEQTIICLYGSVFKLVPMYQIRSWYFTILHKKALCRTKAG